MEVKKRVRKIQVWKNEEEKQKRNEMEEKNKEIVEVRRQVSVKEN